MGRNEMTEEKNPRASLVRPGPKPGPRLLTDQVRTQIVAIIRAGGTYQTAAEVAGISKSSLKRWLAIGERAAEQGAKTEREEQAEALWREVSKERGKFKHGMSKHIADVASDDWKAAAWMLSKLEPESYGDRQAIEHSGRVETDGQAHSMKEVLVEVKDTIEALQEGEES
jgi:hypothetical protein